jgi:hypothetical protein
MYKGFELVKVASLISRTLMCTNIHRYTSIYVCTLMNVHIDIYINIRIN